MLRPAFVMKSGSPESLSSTSKSRSVNPTETKLVSVSTYANVSGSSSRCHTRTSRSRP